MNSTTKLSSFVVFILVGARVFSLTFYGVNGHIWVEHLLTRLPGGEIGFLIVVNILVFVLAFFLDFFELAFIIVPLLGAGRRQARHRPDLVRRAARRQHADLVHASAVRLCAVLSALGRAGAALHRQGHRQADRAGHHRPDLLGRGALRRHPGDHGRRRHRLPGDGDALQGHGRPAAAANHRGTRRAARRRQTASLPGLRHRPLAPRRASGTPPATGNATPPAPPGTDLSKPPSFGTPPADGGAEQQPAPPGTDLSKPPSFGTPPANGGG